MIPYPHIDPVIFRIGPFAARWYGMMYLVGFASAYFLIRRQMAHSGEDSPDQKAFLDGLFVALVVGVIVGGRLGYVLFYNLSYYLHHPLEIAATWHGGMSFHGGLAGALTAGWWQCRRHGEPFLKWADRGAVVAPIGLGLGRIGNFINGELYGRPSHLPWAMVFPLGGPLPRHPSQIYEALLEGVLLFAVMWGIHRRPWPHGRKLALFLMGYGTVRILAEFFREPDPQLGYFLGWITMGQILSAVLVAAGALLWKHTKKGAPAGAP